MFLCTMEVGAARLAVTDRLGGTSLPPYDELNLGGHVGDDPARVATNRKRVGTELGVPPERLLFSTQVHGVEVTVVDGPWSDGQPPEGDALVTATPGLALGVVVADCTPVLLAAPDAGVIGAAHAGRRGMAGGVVPATVAAMQSLGADPARISALVGPAICGRCYEVPAAMRAEVVAAEPAARSTTRDGTPALDVSAGVVAQLHAAGVATVEVEHTCTAESSRLFSHRRDQVTGRFAGVAVLPASR